MFDLILVQNYLALSGHFPSLSKATQHYTVTLVIQDAMFLTHGYTTCWVAFKLAGPTVLNLLALGMALAQKNVNICTE